MPLWRNWQTRWTQNPVLAREYGFDPHRRHILGSINLVKTRFMELFSLLTFKTEKRTYCNSLKKTFLKAVALNEIIGNGLNFVNFIRY